MGELKFEVGDIVRLKPGSNRENTGIATEDVGGLFVVWSAGTRKFSNEAEYQIDTYPVRRARWWANEEWLIRDEFMTAIHRVEQRRKYHAGSKV